MSAEFSLCIVSGEDEQDYRDIIGIMMSDVTNFRSLLLTGAEIFYLGYLNKALVVDIQH